MIRRITIAIVAACVLGLLAFVVLAWQRAIAPIEPPSRTKFSAELIGKGEMLSAAGHCAACHIRQGGRPFAGGYPLITQFGTIYSTNITPDPETGISLWPLEAFVRAMHEGVARDGTHLFPTFPYNHYTKLSDGDVAALYAYFMTLSPVRATPPANTIPFPLNIRWLQEGWKIVFSEADGTKPTRRRAMNGIAERI